MLFLVVFAVKTAAAVAAEFSNESSRIKRRIRSNLKQVQLGWDNTWVFYVRRLH